MWTRVPPFHTPPGNAHFESSSQARQALLVLAPASGIWHQIRHAGRKTGQGWPQITRQTPCRDIHIERGYLRQPAQILTRPPLDRGTRERTREKGRQTWITLQHHVAGLA